VGCHLPSSAAEPQLDIASIAADGTDLRGNGVKEVFDLRAVRFAREQQPNIVTFAKCRQQKISEHIGGTRAIANRV
ncbi:MAG: hypothetical protein ACK4NZ_10910, partial [Tsuneonella sp.]